VEKMKKAKVEREPTEEIDLLDKMLSSLVDLLVEKGIITEEEYEKRLKEKVKIWQLRVKMENTILGQPYR
jgi:membrane peptidoglycan carboxypeptidase